MKRTAANVPGPVWALISLLLVQILIAVIVPVGGGPVRDSGLDITVTGITFSSVPFPLGLSPQTVTARLENSGTLSYAPDVNVTLDIFYPAGSPSPSIVFTNTTTVGTALSAVGANLSIDFIGWTPAQEGMYLVRVSANVSDDHPANDTKEATVEVMDLSRAGVRVGVDVSEKKIKIGESTQTYPNYPYTFTIRNTGPLNDTFDIEIDSEWVMPGWKNVTANLSKGSFEDVYVDVAVPMNAGAFDFDILVFTATSRRNGFVSDNGTVKTSIPNKAGVEVSVVSEDPQTAYPGGEYVYFTYSVLNSGDFSDRFDLEVAARPSNWIAELMTPIQTPWLNPSESITAMARLLIPALDYDTMDEDLTEKGDVGALVLKARSPMSNVTNSGEGTVYVGLVHTVLLEVTPPNATLPFRFDATQNISFNVRVRSINNIRDSPGIDMDVNLTLPEGPNGVWFTPVWQPSKNLTESKRWFANVPAGTISLKSGEWSVGQELEVTAPMFPFQGTAVATVEAVPLLGPNMTGLAIPMRKEVKVFVRPYIDFDLKSPVTDYFDDAELEKDDDLDGSGIEDWREGAPGEVLLLPFNITNRGNTWDTYSIEGGIILEEPTATLPADWEFKFPKGTETLEPAEFPNSSKHSTLLWATVRVPDGTPIGESANITLIATSLLSVNGYPGGLITKRASITVHVVQGYGVDLSPEVSGGVAQPLETVVYRLNLTNVGNGADTFGITYRGNEVMGWTVELDVYSVDLAPLQQATLTMRVTPLIDAVKDQVLSLRVRAGSLYDGDTFDEVWVNTSVGYVGIAELELLSQSPMVWKFPGETVTFDLELRNKGNGDDTFDIDLFVNASSWSASLDPSSSSVSTRSLAVGMGKTAKFKINITLPSLAEAASLQDLEELRILAGTKVLSTISATPRLDVLGSSRLELTIGVLKEFKANVRAQYGESLYKEVLVGETAEYLLALENRGNGEDVITAFALSQIGSARHLSWASLEGGRIPLSPFGSTNLTMRITPDPDDGPLFHEEVLINVEARAGDNLTYRRVDIGALIAMSRVLSEDLYVDLNTEGEISIRICNMPDPGDTPLLGFPMQRTYDVNLSVYTEDGNGIGWVLPEPSSIYILTNLYQLMDVRLPIQAPTNVIHNSTFARVDTVISGGGEKYEVKSVFAHATYFDAALDMEGAKFQNLYEGAKARAFITLTTSGNRGQDTVPVLVRADGRIIGTYDAGPANPQDYVGNTQSIVITFEFELPRLRWYQKGEDVDLEIVVDPDNEIVENTQQGMMFSENNNVLEKEFTVKNYFPPVAVLGLLFVILFICALGGVLGALYIEKRNNWFLLPLAFGFSGVLSLLFYVPLERGAGELGVANLFGLGVIYLDLLFVIPIMVYLFSRSSDPYIIHLINKRRDKDRIEAFEVTTSIWKPYAISLLGGILVITIPVAIWVLPSGIANGFGPGLGGLFGSDGGFPIWTLLFIIPAISVLLQLIMLSLKRAAFKRVEKTYDNLERLKIEIEEGLK